MNAITREQAFEAHRSGDLVTAERLYRELLQATPADPELLHYLGVVRYQAGHRQDAVQWLRKALAQAPGSLPTLQLLFQVCDETGDTAGALDALDRHLALHPGDPVTLNLKGQQLIRIGRHGEAEACFRQAAERGGKADMYHDLGVCRQLLGDLKGAANAYSEAIRRGQDHPRTRLWLAQCLRAIGRTQEYYEVAAGAASPSSHGDLELLIEGQAARRHVCDWDGFERHQPALLKGLEQALEAGRGHDIPPGILNYLDIDEGLIAAFARRHAQAISAEGATLRGKLPGRRPRDGNTRIRLGYLSTDFYNHAVGSLVRDLFASHDRDRFEVYGYSLRHRPDEIQARIQRGCDHYRNLEKRSAEQIARTILDDQIDILIDLAGYTSAAQPAVLAARPAPVQISWLGYLGTSGSDFIDYVVADEIALPPELARNYSEQFIRLPCFLPASRLEATQNRPSRADAGLTTKGIVFCSFNQPYKLDRATFRAWMEILRQVPDSQLWLYAPDSDTCVRQLRQEAACAKIDPDRLVFAPRLPMAEHVARMSLADLALDPFHISGGATSVTCLAGGLPVLTLRGHSFLARMGSAINASLGIKGLDCTGPEQYIDRAIALASCPSSLRTMKERLKSALATRRFFDTRDFAGQLEAALHLAWHRHAEGMPPADIHIHEGTAHARGDTR